MTALILQIAAIPSVMLVFQVAPRWLASILASVIFIIVAIVSMVSFFKGRGFKSYNFWAWSFFLYALVIPILAIRLAAGIFYSNPVEEVFPVIGVLHRISSPYYVLAVLLSILEFVQNKKAAK
ncbi:MAG: hypothetical protein KDD37_08095 [Bdellovibrionales bacterium]|nr:hypothetical protein [Bdellovibrionales bacterium]